ncbi:MAG: HpcH/HpaI aldolase/citrate lyase family protein [Actinomycetota bacterium]|nr:HpcH/HpaI aldolase/citrate lyase family protein [Actinomycetota bacterium]
MQHFHHLTEPVRRGLFAHPPEVFDASSPRHDVGTALGATLYLPATRPHLVDDLQRQGARGVVSAVVCLEDAIADSQVEQGQAHTIASLRSLAERVGDSPATTPLVFVRVRRPEQVVDIAADVGDPGVLAGFVLPKFTAASGVGFLQALEQAAQVVGRPLLAMPVIESPEVVHLETRHEVLAGVRALLARHREVVPAVRIGATDLCAALGVRRSRELTAYDIGAVAATIYDIANVLGRADGSGFVISGPVWEYFADRNRLFKPQLRETPFAGLPGPSLRHALLDHDVDGLIREIVLDQANGLTGKTVVHPSHVAAVHALSVVSLEEHSDALDVVGQSARGGGALASGYRNKMNEAGPHLAWAQRTIVRARMYGVAREDVGPVDLLAALAAAPQSG